METPSQTDWLDDLLSQDEAIADSGFSQRVLAALPPEPLDRRLRMAIMLGMTVLASVLALFVLPGGEFVQSALVSLFALNGWHVPTLGGLAFAGMLGWGAWSLVAVEG